MCVGSALLAANLQLALAIVVVVVVVAVLALLLCCRCSASGVSVVGCPLAGWLAGCLSHSDRVRVSAVCGRAISLDAMDGSAADVVVTAERLCCSPRERQQ